MKDKRLSGIERELVLQYLIDGNVPVTITPVETVEKNDSQIKPLNSQVFPIAIKGEHLTVQNNGKIILENPNATVLKNLGKKIKVEFYFNRVGLFFISELKQENDEICIQFPDVIDRIEDIEEVTKYSFSGLIYFEYKTTKDLSIKLIPWKQIELFTRPVWKTIPLENQQNAKRLLEELVSEAKSNNNIGNNIGNGIQLIPICNYLTFNFNKKHNLEALENRIKPIDILYIDHERIVLGCDKSQKILYSNDEYGLKISFSLDKGPISSRDIFITFAVNKEYHSENKNRICYDCKYTTIQEEDLRYLYEKATKSLFN